MHKETPLDQSSLVITHYGEAAYQRLATAVREVKGDDPLAPVTVVTPTHYVALAAARTLASLLRTKQNLGNGIAAAEFVTVDDLAKRLGGSRIAALDLNLVSNTVIAGTVRTILRNDPGYFAGIETHPATEKALVAAHKELSEISADKLDALSEQSDRVADVVRIHHEVSATLYPHVNKNMKVNSAQGDRLHSSPRFCNFRQLVEQAEIALKTNAEVAEQLGVVVLFLPQHLTYSKIKLLRSVMSITPTTVIAGFTGFYDADAAVRSSLAGLPVKPTFTYSHETNEIEHPRRPTPHTFDPRTGEGRKTNEIEHLRRLLKERALKAVSVSDPDDEVRHAVREIISAARSGKKLGKCAIVYGSSQPYARLIGDALDVAGIKHCGADVHAADTSWLGRTVTGLLSLHGNRFSRQRVMAWLDKAHIEIPCTDKTQENDANHKNSSPHSQDVPSKSFSAAEPFPSTENIRWRMAPTAAWERITRTARVNTGLSDWESRLRLYIDGRRSEAERIIDNSISEQYLSLAQHYNQQAELAEQLLALINRLYNDLHPKPLPRTWTELAKWCQQLIRRYCDNKKRRSGWPDHEKKLADKVYEAIDRLSTLDGIDDDPSPVRFRHALEVELANSYHTRGLFGSGVLVGPPSLIFGLELDLLVVCGLAEGVFPSRHHVNALLPDMERLNTATELGLNSARNSDQHREFLSAIASSERILLLYPRGDLRRSTENSPSRWLLDIAEATNPQGIRLKGDDLASATSGWFEEIPSFVSSLRRMNFPTNEQEYDTHVLFHWYEQHKAGQHNPRSILQNHIVVRRPALKRGFELALARKSSRLTRFDGNLHTDGNLRGAELPNPVSNPISASRLEAWVRCPHAYFVRHILNVEPITDELDNYRISPLDLGSVTHEILERWMLEALEADDIPKPHEPWPMRWIQRLLDIAEERCDYLEKAGLNGQRIYWHSDRKRLMDDLRKFIDFDDNMRSQRKSTPIAAELGFGLPGAE
ncbi:MAG: PD-(D/E)XK nuclease family protein, partial [Acidimicrobiaceae bacterium]|nr:PD-(D/E)XK nuclease family protein [Acidimicrobiaceae bacterium]